MLFYINKINLILLFISCALFSCKQNNKEKPDTKDEATLKKEINSFVDQWHKDAANADTAYFHKIAAGGIYIGTDKTEHWPKAEFQAWSKKYFDKGKAWAFTATERNIYFADDASYAWFDELLNTQMGVCRASGVLQHTNKEWKIKHYQLSVAIPNDILDSVIKTVADYEKGK